MIRPVLYRFATFELDTPREELREGGVVRPLERQVFALLALLVEHRERLVSKDELLEKVWDGRIVSEAAIASRVKSARQALGDDGKTQRFLKTIHGRGFRFVAEVRVEHDVGLPGEPAPSGSDTPGRPSIAVLPLQRIADAGPWGALADALPHELIADLSRLRWLFVTARGSSFRFRSAEFDVREVGRLLGVRYCLSGSLEVTGSRIQVTVDLTDTKSGEVVWAERFPGRLDDVHTIREQIRARILSALEIRIPSHEAAKARLAGTEHLDAWSAYHLGLQHMYRFNRRDNAEAAAMFARALERDPAFARAHAGLSFVHFQNAFLRLTNDLSGETALARRHAERAVEIDALDPFANFTMGRTFWLDGNLDDSLGWLERSTTISPNYAQGIYARAWTDALAGRSLEGRGHVDLAMQLSPLDPLFYAMLGTRAFTHMTLGEDDAAAEWAERAARSPGAHVLIAMIAVATQDLAGRAERAGAWAANVRERSPALTQEDFFRSFPMKLPDTKSRVAAALSRHGF
jgi:TolB-like protein